MKSIYFKNFLATAIMVLVSFMMIGMAFLFIGQSFVIKSHKDSMEQIQTALDYMAKIPAANSEDQLTPERVVKLIRVFSRVLNLEALHAMGSSVKKMPDGLTNYRSFVYTGDSALQGVLFDLAGRENRSLTLPARLPESTILAFETRLDFATAWNSFCKALAESPELPPEAKNVPANLEAACRAAGVELVTLLKTISGTWSMLVVAADPAVSPLPMSPCSRATASACAKSASELLFSAHRSGMTPQERLIWR